jgi:hypothetical protein
VKLCKPVIWSVAAPSVAEMVLAAVMALCTVLTRFVVAASAEPTMETPL